MSCKHYTASWATTGCTRLLLDSARVHAVSLQHEVSWNLYLKNEGLSLREHSGLNKGVNPSQRVFKNEANTRQKKNVNAWIPL